MAFDFSAARKQAEADGKLGGGEFFKVKDGNNRIRLLSECLPHTSTFDGRKNFKWLCYILDRKDGEVKPYFMPHRIYKNLEALQIDPDYAFESVPMPYDVTVHVKKAGTKEVEYTLLPARTATGLTGDELDKLDAMKPLSELKKILKEKQDARTADEAPPPARGDLMDEPPF